MKAKDLCIYQMNKSILILDTRTLKYINVYDSEIGERFISFFDEWLLINGELFNNELKYKPNDEVLFLELKLK